MEYDFNGKKIIVKDVLEKGELEQDLMLNENYVIEEEENGQDRKN